MGTPPWERHQGVNKERERARSWEMKSSRNFGEEADSISDSIYAPAPPSMPREPCADARTPVFHLTGAQDSGG